MLMPCKEMATRYAGRTVRCKVIKSSPVTDDSGKVLDYFDAKIVGWKESSSYVCVEVLPPGMTATLLEKFNLGYHYTVDKRNGKGYGKKLLPEEIIPPADTGTVMSGPKSKTIPEWPHKCRDCGSPAQVFGNNIDCSNSSCKNKYRTHSGLDLFLPKDMRPPGWEKDPHRKRRPGVDKEDFIVCGTCHGRANGGTFVKDKVGTLKATCAKDHSWTFELNIGDKLAGKDRTLIYKGKNIFIPYRV